MDLRNIFRKLSISEIDVIIAIAKSIRYEKTAATSDTIDTDTVTRRVKWVIEIISEDHSSFGIYWSDFSKIKRSTIKRFRNVGEKTLREINEELMIRNITFFPEGKLKDILGR